MNIIDLSNSDDDVIINHISMLMNSKEKNNVILLSKNIDFFIKVFDNDKITGLFLSAYTLSSHKHHENITAVDYCKLKVNVPLGYTKSKSKDNHYKVFYSMDEFYKAIYKITKNNEVFLVSLTKGSSIAKQIESQKKKGDFARV